MLVNIFINVLIVEAYLNQNKVIAVFFVAMVLLNVRQSSHDIQLVHMSCPEIGFLKKTTKNGHKTTSHKR